MSIPEGERCHNHPVAGPQKRFSGERCPNAATVELAPMNVFFVPPEARTYYCEECANSAVETGHYRDVNGNAVEKE